MSSPVDYSLPQNEVSAKKQPNPHQSQPRARRILRWIQFLKLAICHFRVWCIQDWNAQYRRSPTPYEQLSFDAKAMVAIFMFLFGFILARICSFIFIDADKRNAFPAFWIALRSTIVGHLWGMLWRWWALRATTDDEEAAFGLVGEDKVLEEGVDMYAVALGKYGDPAVAK